MVKQRQWSWRSAIIALIVTLAVMFGSQTIWHTFVVARPLDTAFRDIAGVQAVAWEQQKTGEVVLSAVFMPNADLPAAYQAIERQAQQVLGSINFLIEIENMPAPELAASYQQLHFMVAEGIATGRFQQMAEQVAAQAAEDGITATLKVQTNNVYVTLVKDDTWFYQVVPRTISVKQGVS